MSDELTRKGFWWVESASGEMTRVTDRFRFEYHDGQGRVYVVETEPSLDVKPLFTRTLQLDGSNEPLPEPERERIMKRIVVMLQFSGDEFRLVN